MSVQLKSSTATACDLCVAADGALLVGWSHLFSNVWDGGALAVARDGTQRAWANGAGVAAVASFGEHAVAAGDDGALHLRSVGGARTITHAHDGIVSSLAAGDGVPLVSGSFDGTVRVWAADLARGSATTLTHADAVLGVAHAPALGGAATVLACTRDGVAALWDTRAAKCVRVVSLRRRCALTTIAATAHGFAVGALDGQLALFDLRAGAPDAPTAAIKAANAISRVRVLDADSLLAVDDDGRLIRWNATQGAQSVLFTAPMPLRSLAVDGKRCFVGVLGRGRVESVALSE